MSTTVSPSGEPALARGAVHRTLHLTSPALAGEDVLAVQKALARLGYAPGPRDGIYGAATAAAVRQFQAATDLQADGVVGPMTVAALEHARVHRGAHARDRKGGGPGVKALAEAIKHIGVTEQPVNRTRFGRWFGVDGVPWCNIFVSYCFKIGADYSICAGYRAAGVYPRGCAYVPTTEAWLRAEGMWLGRTTPHPGDIAIYNWDSRGVPEHIGIVEKYLGGGKFDAIEGNTSVASNSNGGAVMRRLRYVSQVDGFGRVR